MRFPTACLVLIHRQQTRCIPTSGNSLYPVDDYAQRAAWAVRGELSRRALKAYGSFPEIAKALNASKKTVYRYLTPEGKDKTMPPLPFVVELVALLQSDHDGMDFASFWEYATRDVE